MADGIKVKIAEGLAHMSSVSLTAEAAGNYADNDVVSNSDTNGEGDALEFTNAVKGNAGAGRLVGASIACDTAAVTASTRIHLFSQEPTASELDDNAAFSLHADDVPYYLGFVQMDALSSGFALPSTLTPGAPLFVHAESGKSLFGILQFTDAETNEAAGMVFTIKLFVE